MQPSKQHPIAPLTCPLCDATVYTPMPFELQCCQNCGLVMSKDASFPEKETRLEQEWFEETYDLNLTFWERTFEYLNNRRTYTRLARSGILSGSVLEIGVGSGSLLSHLKNRGFSVEGCDLSHFLCNNLEKRLGIKTYSEGIASIPKQMQYDVIIMNHVLEHTADPSILLQGIKTHLKASGFLHLAVPNYSCWEARLSGWGSFQPYHLIYYTPDTLKRMMRKYGFKCSKSETHESFSGWFIALFRSLKRKQGVPSPNTTTLIKKQSWVRHPYRLLMVGFGVITFPLRLFQALLGKGDEIIILAQL